MDSAPPLTSQPPAVEPSTDSALAAIVPPFGWRAYGLRCLIWLVIGCLLWIGLVGGLRLRRFVFETSDPIRYVSDMKRNVFWALAGSGPEGMLNQYEKMAPELPEWRDSNWVPWFDDGPLRMLAMKCWGAWIRHNHPPQPGGPWTDAWQPEYQYTAPMLHFNAAMEGRASVFAFFLTRLWIRRASAQQPPPHFCGVWRAMAAALLIWFNPAVLVSGYMWTTCDSWILPFFLLAALLASLDWWFCSGLALAVGAMFKGQQLAVVPVFIVWPLVQGSVGAALRWCIGLLAGFAAICVGQSIGMALLGIFLGLVTASMAMQVMLENCSVSTFGQSLAGKFPWLCSPDSGDTIYRYINGIHPEVAWGVLATTAIFFCISLTRSPRTPPQLKRG